MTTVSETTDKIKELVKPGKLLIGGEWVDASDNATLETINPATGEVITTFAEVRNCVWT